MNWDYLVYNAVQTRFLSKGPSLIVIEDLADDVSLYDKSITCRRVGSVLKKLGLVVRGKISNRRGVFVTAESLEAAKRRLDDLNIPEVK